MGFSGLATTFFFSFCLEGECTTVATVARCQLKRRVSELYRAPTNEELNFSKKVFTLSRFIVLFLLEGTWEDILT